VSSSQTEHGNCAQQRSARKCMNLGHLPWGQKPHVPDRNVGSLGGGFSLLVLIVIVMIRAITLVMIRLIAAVTLLVAGLVGSLVVVLFEVSLLGVIAVMLAVTLAIAHTQLVVLIFRIILIVSPVARLVLR
jgi:hypothetical protein